MKLVRAFYHDPKGRYGYRRIHLTLKYEGITLNHKTVQLLMGRLNLKSTVRPKTYRSYRGNIGNSAPTTLNVTSLLASQMKHGAPM
ncbi:IS3 family transposase [Rosenbergiella collisarenosi]|uniref:IS3 family transposase n=1 Tax=Rosenbergiella collisarenosi TaxID=1544695 RepID=UPI003BAABAF4